MELSDLTTLRLGGAAHRVVDGTTDEEIIEAVVTATSAGESLLTLGGGSNIVISDEGFPGTVLRVRNRGISIDREVLTARAGEPWEGVVRASVAAGLVGIECLTGIPGSVGAAPIQNVGAYGQEVKETIAGVRAFARRTGRVVTLRPDELWLDYRTSRFKEHPDEFVVLAASFKLERSASSAPIRYERLADALGVSLGETVDVALLQEEVLRLRRKAGMVVDGGDADSVSAGSFFVNPTMSPGEFGSLEARSIERIGPSTRPAHQVLVDGQIRVHAWWLIKNAGFGLGYGSATGAAISTKHHLALINHGKATTRELLALAHEIALKVHDAFDVWLRPEPVLVGQRWPAGPADAVWP